MKSGWTHLYSTLNDIQGDNSSVGKPTTKDTTKPTNSIVLCRAKLTTVLLCISVLAEYHGRNEEGYVMIESHSYNAYLGH